MRWGLFINFFQKCCPRCCRCGQTQIPVEIIAQPPAQLEIDLSKVPSYYSYSEPSADSTSRSKSPKGSSSPSSMAGLELVPIEETVQTLNSQRSSSIVSDGESFIDSFNAFKATNFGQPHPKQEEPAASPAPAPVTGEGGPFAIPRERTAVSDLWRLNDEVSVANSSRSHESAYWKVLSCAKSDLQAALAELMASSQESAASGRAQEFHYEYMSVANQEGLKGYYNPDKAQNDFPPLDDWSIVVTIPKSVFSTSFTEMQNCLHKHGIQVFWAFTPPDNTLVNLPPTSAAFPDTFAAPNEQNVLLFIDFAWHERQHNVDTDEFLRLVTDLEELVAHVSEGIKTELRENHESNFGDFTAIEGKNWVGVGRYITSGAEHTSSSKPPGLESFLAMAKVYHPQPC